MTVDKTAALRVVDIIEAAGSPRPREEFLRQVRLLDCVREVIERAHGVDYWATVYRAADRIRNERAAKVERGEASWES